MTVPSSVAKSLLLMDAMLISVSSLNAKEAAASGAAPSTPASGERRQILLSDAPWRFFGLGAMEALPKIGLPEFKQGAWQTVLRTGKNEVAVSDDAGHTDSATIYFYGTGGEPEVPPQNPLVEDLQSSNPANVAYFMDMPVQARWPIYYDLDATADNSFAGLPAPLEGARWIATRRVTKPGQETELSFKVTRPATVFVACTQGATEPAYLTATGFKEEDAPGFMWRDNSLLLVPATLYSHQPAAEETVHLAQPDRDQIVLLKENAP